jgi:hypothetical protein
MNEPTMPEEPKANVGIHRDEDGSIHLTFGPGVTAADFIAAFAAIPADHEVDDIFTIWYCKAEGFTAIPADHEMTLIRPTWFSEAGDCAGQDLPDEVHVFPVTTMLMEPAELPAEVDS